MTESRSVVSWEKARCWGVGKEGLQRDKRELLAVMDMFSILIMEMVSWVSTFIKTY